MTYTKNLTITLLATSVLMSGCIYETRPELTPIKTSITQKLDNRMVEAPIVKPREAARSTGSLWQKGAKGFFKDNRARNVGDIVTVIVSETAKAEVEAKTDSSRAHDAFSSVDKLLNLTGMLKHAFIADPITGDVLDTDTARTFKGDGSTEREDKFEGRIAAMVTEVMPNGYLIIQGQREVLINYEMQQMRIQGIIRTEDISANNTIPSEKIAEARIAYTGRGMVDESQEMQPAARFIDKWLPF